MLGVKHFCSHKSFGTKLLWVVVLMDFFERRGALRGIGLGAKGVMKNLIEKRSGEAFLSGSEWNAGQVKLLYLVRSRTPLGRDVTT